MVFNPLLPQRQEKALALFDVGSQISFIPKKINKSAKPEENSRTRNENSSVWMKKPKTCITTRTQLTVQTAEQEILSAKYLLHCTTFENLGPIKQMNESCNLWRTVCGFRKLKKFRSFEKPQG
ncbi:unnamed protein product [Onchocerca flexuosa]|uniref:DUF1758 domain-containing protein n=1 Tax=Onchocerca flexuosa TaxID=387005 RepID=A0A183GYN3_9BILA|nr:unnamed protein product [Onchocerca flexuosa]